VSEFAEHFRLTSETMRRRLDEAGIKPVAQSPERYSWHDVWTRLEGTTEVLPEDEAQLRRPLLTPSEVQERHFPHLSIRTITDRAKRGALPAIRIGSDWRFRERDVREASRHG
jgi:hypothetical protein